MRFHSILFPTPAQEAQAVHCPWLLRRPRRAYAEEMYITRGNKTLPLKQNDLTEAPPTPVFFSDTGLDSILDEVLGGREESPLRRMYYALSVDADTVRYRQEIVRALETKEIYDLFLPFCHAVESALRTMADGQKAHAPAQGDAYIAGGALEYCGTVRALLKAADGREIPSDGLRAFVDAVRAAAQTPRFTRMESLLRQAIDGLEAISFSLRIRNGRIQVGARVPDGDLIRETGGDLIRLEERADNALPREIRLFGELALNPLGMRIADVLQETHPAVFSLLHQAAEAARGVPEPFIRGFMEDIRFYTRYLDVARELRAKGLPFACPALSGDEVRITGAYDMELALKQEQVVVNDCRLSPDERGIIITGANHSGKTTYIRAIGQIAALTALGLPVPCAEAKIPLFKQFFSHFSDAERGEARQGRLMEELDKLKPICKQMEEGSFVLLNEMFSSTTAQDAQGLAKRILDNFVDQGARVLCVTHTMEQIPKRMVSMAAQVAPGSHKRLYTVVRAPTEIHAHIDVLIDQYGLTYQAIKERIGYDV